MLCIFVEEGSICFGCYQHLIVCDIHSKVEFQYGCARSFCSILSYWYHFVVIVVIELILCPNDFILMNSTVVFFICLSFLAKSESVKIVI